MNHVNTRRFFILWGLLSSLFWLSGISVFAQSQEVNSFSGIEEREVARLISGDEEARLSSLVELASLFKISRRTPRPATVAALIQVLRNDPVPVLRTHAARVFEYGAPSSATDALLTSLNAEKDVATRKAVLYALARYQGGPVTAAIIPYLRNKDVELRTTAAYVLAELADTASASALHESFIKQHKDQDAPLRAEAARAFGRIGYRASLPDLVKALHKDKDLVKRAAAEALGWLANKQDLEAIGLLQTATQEEDPYLREAAQLALKRINVRAASQP